MKIKLITLPSIHGFRRIVNLASWYSRAFLTMATSADFDPQLVISHKFNEVYSIPFFFSSFSVFFFFFFRCLIWDHEIIILQKTVTYTERDAAIYALGVGACVKDALDDKELKFVYHPDGQERIQVCWNNTTENFFVLRFKAG